LEGFQCQENEEEKKQEKAEEEREKDKLIITISCIISPLFSPSGNHN